MKIEKRIETVSFWENSFGPMSEPQKVMMDVMIEVTDEHSWFEISDDDGEFHAEGILEIEDKVLTGYDGIFELPDYIITELKKLGIDTSEIE